MANAPARHTLVDVTQENMAISTHSSSTEQPMRNRAGTGALFVLLLTVAGWPAARAQQPNSAGQTAPANGWTFNVAPYLWFPNVNVSLEYNLPPALGGRLPTDASVGPGDIFRHLDFGLMFAADARNGPFSILTDFIGTRFSATGSSVNIKSVDFFGQSPIPISRALQTSTGSTLGLQIWTLAGGYTILQNDWGNLDLIAGTRLLAVNARTDFSLALSITGPRGNGATFGGIGDVTASRTVADAIGGLRGRFRINNTPLFVPYYFDIGTGGSQLTWQIASGLGYQFNKWGAVSVTYRYLSFHHGSATVDTVTLKGPVLMANFSF
jgi:hypothetical protein